MSTPEVLVSATADELATRVAEQLLDVLAAAQAEGRVPAVALTGGTIAIKIHEAIAAASDADRVDWAAVDVWFGDERYVPAADEDRNELQARDSMLSHLPFDPARIHAMPASDAGHASLDDAAAAYGAELRAGGSGEFDVVMLGVGPDGHVASLFPGFSQLDVDDQIAVGVTDSPKPPPERISLTFPALNRAAQVWFVVSGDGKAEAVSRGLAQSGDVHETPARGVSGRARTVWFLDADAASASGRG